ncbi:hypothetical protein ACFC0M_36505 [Streptomyces sp. NPDC056149]|nr:hypothetical protein [Streptomyces sp. WZ-12]
MTTLAATGHLDPAGRTARLVQDALAELLHAQPAGNWSASVRRACRSR